MGYVLVVHLSRDQKKRAFFENRVQAKKDGKIRVFCQKTRPKIDIYGAHFNRCDEYITKTIRKWQSTATISGAERSEAHFVVE